MANRETKAKVTDVQPFDVDCKFCGKQFRATTTVEHQQEGEESVSLCEDCYKKSLVILAMQAMAGDQTARELLKKNRF